LRVNIELDPSIELSIEDITAALMAHSPSIDTGPGVNSFRTYGRTMSDLLAAIGDIPRVVFRQSVQISTQLSVRNQQQKQQI